MMEILITIVVLAIGLLGLSKLQMEALRYSHGANLRTQATFLAYDIIDRMRANRTQATSGSDLNFPYVTAVGTTETASSNCVGTSASCSASEMADFDLAEWKTSIAAALPIGDGAITRSSGVYTVEIRWTDNRRDTSTPTTVTISTQL